ncbi:hypothetical protein GOBAR_AA39700 [Gossypium barbadense]|uniref:BHLH domain-containing protein n=1 Tax=Gossypium barbadense TaxID=3634 RepID=A0A2P5VQ87_GOSBA|nr:hypothetical protein GOBAR_AA39700 [Gossypium barbadense]
MNHCVPDFEMEDDYAILSPPSLTRVEKPPPRPEDEIMELLWQNGQVVMQSQNQRSMKKLPSFKLLDADHSAPREIRSSSPSHKHRRHHHQEQQQLVTDHLFMQEDEMASWLHYPISDTNFDHDFCTDLLYPPSSSPTAAVAPCVSSTVATSTPPILKRVSQVSVSASANESVPRPPVPPARRNELEPARIHNFSHFSRHITARAEQSELSNSKSVMGESTVVDSSNIPAAAPELRASQAMPSNTEAASGGNNNNNNNNANANMSAAGVPYLQSADVRLGANKGILATCEVTVTSSPGGSSASAEPTAQKAASAEDRKRKGRELDEAECHSELSVVSANVRHILHGVYVQRRRDRINEKMRALQELIPRCNKSDKASMLDDAIDYLKSLQMQVQMMSMGCGMVPMFPGVQQYISPMGIGMSMGMDMGIIRPMMSFPNVVAGSALPTLAAAAHLGPRIPMPAFHMPPSIPAPDPSRFQPSNQSDPIPNPLFMQNLNQAQQYIGLHQTMQIPHPQGQAMAQPSSRRGAEKVENHPTGRSISF